MEVSERVSEEGPGELKHGSERWLSRCRSARDRWTRATETRATPTTRATGDGADERETKGLIVLARSASRPFLRGGRRPGRLAERRRGTPARRVGESSVRHAHRGRYIRYAGRDVRGDGVGETIARALGNVGAATVPRRRASCRACALAPRAEDASAGPEGKPSAMMHRDKGVCRYNRPPRVGRRTRVSTVTHLVERTAGAAAMVIEADAILN